MGKTRIVAPRAELAPATLLVGDLAIKILTAAEHIDFLLSVRDERFATMLQFFRNSGWLLIGVAAALWLAYEYKRHRANPNAVGSVGAVVFSTALVAFLVGVVITVWATGSLPNIVQNYAGDPNNQTCIATVDTSHLIGLQDDYRLILLCGMQDPEHDAWEDTRIAVSSPFHINGGPIMITTPLGRIMEGFANLPPLPPGQSRMFSMWHTIAAIPQDADPTTIKRASDVKRLGGRMLTDPVGGLGSPMMVPPNSGATQQVVKQPS
jgi:hypothetical protein